jgi:hypothetical protein
MIIGLSALQNISRPALLPVKAFISASAKAGAFFEQGNTHHYTAQSIKFLSLRKI